MSLIFMIMSNFLCFLTTFAVPKDPLCVPPCVAVGIEWVVPVESLSVVGRLQRQKLWFWRLSV